MRTKFIEYVDNNQERMMHIVLIGNKIYLKNQLFFDVCHNIQFIPNPSDIVETNRWVSGDIFGKIVNYGNS